MTLLKTTTFGGAMKDNGKIKFRLRYILKKELPFRSLFVCVIQIFTFLVLPILPSILFAYELSCNGEIKLGKDFFIQGDYSSAIYQFKRVLSLCEEIDIKQEAQYFLGVSYLFANKHEEAEKQFISIIEAKDHKYAEQAIVMLSFVLERQQKAASTKDYLSNLLNYNFKDNTLRESVHYKLAWLNLRSGELESASEHLREIKSSTELVQSAKELLSATKGFQELPYKSPTLSGFLSACMPGAGQFYVGRPKDGLTAFIVNGLFIGATVQAFEHDQEFLGVMLGALELGWYIGNIYNATNSAHKYNKKVREDYWKGYKDELNLNLLINNKGELGISFGFKF
jgi:TM2 domain-containing membrane protein YozV